MDVNAFVVVKQGGNNIRAEGVNAIAQALKDNAIITTVSAKKKNSFSSLFPCLLISAGFIVSSVRGWL